MKTYSETKNKKPIHWNLILQPNRKRKLTRKQLLIMEKKSAGWITCACGNQCDIIPRSSFGGRPFDEPLYRLGVRFHSLIAEMHYNFGDDEAVEVYRVGAVDTLKKIEKRSALLIKETLKLYFILDGGGAVMASYLSYKQMQRTIIEYRRMFTSEPFSFHKYSL